MNVPESAVACDAASQQLPAVNQWGHEYVGVRYRSRLGEGANDGESVPWRVTAAIDGTALAYDPAPPTGAPASLKAGESATFWSATAFTVRSQDIAHPIFMSAFMTGGEDYNGIGDPEFVNVVPSDQYLDHYVFFADVTYKETSLVLVRQRTKGAFKDVTLDCAGGPHRLEAGRRRLGRLRVRTCRPLARRRAGEDPEGRMLRRRPRAHERRPVHRHRVGLGTTTRAMRIRRARAAGRSTTSRSS